MKILIVDDSTTIRRIVKRACEELGHTTSEAADSSDGLSTLNEQHEEVSLIILDWHMPGISSLGALKMIRDDPRTKGIPVLMLTSESDINFVKEALAAGAQNYITKPFDQKMIGLKIQETLAMVVS